jgi:hypothetical protein
VRPFLRQELVYSNLPICSQFCPSVVRSNFADDYIFTSDKVGIQLDLPSHGLRPQIAAYQFFLPPIEDRPRVAVSRCRHHFLYKGWCHARRYPAFLFAAKKTSVRFKSSL